MNMRQSKTPSKMFFMKHFFTTPRGVGSLIPSGRILAKAMVASLDFHADDIVLELGPGTGVFTRELLAKGVRPENLILIEFNGEFAKFLQREFPTLRVVEGDAAELPLLLQTLGINKVKRIISGIPMRNLNAEQCGAITAAIAASLDVGGVIVQFTYIWRPPLAKVAAHLGGLIGRRTAMALRNVPPAFVWRYVKT